MATKFDIRHLWDRLRHMSFDWGMINRYAWVLHLFVIFILAKTLSNITVSYLEQKIETPSAQQLAKSRPFIPRIVTPALKIYNVIVQRNIFDPNAEPEDLLEKLKETHGDLDEAGAIPSALGFELGGTIVLSDPQRSVATIKDEKNQTEAYQIGDTISDKATIYKVLPYKVYLQNLKSGQLEYIEMPHEKVETPVLALSRPSKPSAEGIQESSPGRFVIDRGALEAALADPSAILTQARAVPNIVGGQIQGFRIFAIKSGSIYQKLGIKNGDVVLRINDVDLDSPAKALEFYGALSSATEISLDIERGGQRINLHYQVK